MSKFLIIILVSSWMTLFATAEQPTTLRLVQLIFRHGDRTPEHYLPTDTINTMNSWPEQERGQGELTQRGMQQHFDFGRYMRQRYVVQNAFLSGNYSASEIHIRSTDYNRTLQSAASFAAGLLYVEGNKLANSQNWRPIPVHTTARKNDHLMLGETCPHYDLSKVIRKTQPDWLAHEAANADFYRWLEQKTGYESVGAHNMDHVTDSIFCTLNHLDDGHTLPSWVTEDVYNKLVELNEYRFNEYVVKQDYNAKLYMGLLLYEMVERMLNRSQTDSHIDYDPRLKFYIYSGHDGQILGFHKQLGSTMKLQPPYASSVILELHELLPKQFFVRAFYRNTTTDYLNAEPYQIQIGGCPSFDCPLETFVARSKSVMLTKNTELQECFGESSHLLQAAADYTTNEDVPSENTGVVIFLSILSVIFFVGFVIACAFAAQFYVILQRQKVESRQSQHERACLTDPSPPSRHSYQTLS